MPRLRLPERSPRFRQTTTPLASALHSGTTGRPRAQHVHGSVLSQFATTRHVLDLRPTTSTGARRSRLGHGYLLRHHRSVGRGRDPGRVRGGLLRPALVRFHRAPPCDRFLHRATPPYADEGAAPDCATTRQSSPHVQRGRATQSAAVLWAERVMGRPFHDTYWQTETGAIMISNVPDCHQTRLHGQAGSRHPGGDPRRQDLAAITTPARRDCSPSGRPGRRCSAATSRPRRLQSKFVANTT